MGIFENEVYPGIREALDRLKQSGATLFVATSKPTTFAERIVEHFALGEPITAVFGSELDGTRSDKAELIAHIMNTRSLDPAATCMVGDRAQDMRGAKANRIRGIGALWGYGSREELVSAGAAALCEQPTDLFEVLAVHA